MRILEVGHLNYELWAEAGASWVLPRLDGRVTLDSVGTVCAFSFVSLGMSYMSWLVFILPKIVNNKIICLCTFSQHHVHRPYPYEFKASLFGAAAYK